METAIQPDQPGVKPAVQVPAGWTKEKDAESFVRNYHPEGSDLYAAAIERIAFEREELEHLLAELIGDFCETSEAAFDLAQLCLSSKAKGDVLMSVIRSISSDERLLGRVEEDLLRIREAFDLCDTIISPPVS